MQKSGAGVVPVMMTPSGASLYLLGEEAMYKNGQRLAVMQWGDFGGKCAARSTLSSTAARELYEESGGIYALTEQQLKDRALLRVDVLLGSKQDYTRSYYFVEVEYDALAATRFLVQTAPLRRQYALQNASQARPTIPSIGSTFKFPKAKRYVRITNVDTRHDGVIVSGVTLADKRPIQELVPVPVGCVLPSCSARTGACEADTRCKKEFIEKERVRLFTSDEVLQRLSTKFRGGTRLACATFAKSLTACGLRL